MFCPSCGKSLPDDARFCDSCGAPTNSLSEPTGETPKTASFAPEALDGQSGSSTVIQNQKDRRSKPEKKRKKWPVIVVLLLLLAVAAAAALTYFGVIRVPGLGSSQPSAQSEPREVEASGSSSDSGSDGDEDESSVSSESASSSTASPNAVSPKSEVSITNLKVSTDSGGRYLITGSVTNSSTNEYAITCSLTALRHDTDKYGDAIESETSSFDLQSATPNVACDGNEITIWGVKPDETRSFTVYPEGWDSSEITYSDVKGVVEEITLPSSVLNHLGRLYDVDGEVKISQVEYSPSGKISGKLTNGSSQYLEWADIRFVMLDAKGELAVGNSSETRPSGVVSNVVRVETVRPGETVDFEKSIGADYAETKFLDVSYLPDTSKQG